MLPKIGGSCPCCRQIQAPLKKVWLKRSCQAVYRLCGRAVERPNAASRVCDRDRFAQRLARTELFAELSGGLAAGAYGASKQR